MKSMLKRLRYQLTFLYLSSSIILAFLVGGGAYSLVRYYFQSTNDQALKVKIGVSLINLGIPIPVYFESALDQAGLAYNAISTPTIPLHSETDEGILAGESEEKQLFEQQSDLADIYLLPLNIEGDLVTGFSSSTNGIPVNLEAIAAAKIKGFDFRTYTNQYGYPVRLLTYIIASNEKVQVFQVGRFLSAQQQVLKQLLRTMTIAGGLVTLFFGLASWLLAGRTIRPSQEAWDKQLTFIANASHELRTPLTLIHAGVELGLRKATDSEQQLLLTDALADADYMKKLIEDLLLLSRLDAHSLKFEIEPVPLEKVITGLTRQMNYLAENQNITIENSLASMTVLADPVRLEQVLLIILDYGTLLQAEA
jgi:signal transduction histidine kinase